MRRQIKRQLTELLNTMKEGILVISTKLCEGEREQLLALLAGQQQAAVAIGNQIEESEGEGTEAVRLLESYCELLWRLSQEQEVGRCTVEELEKVLSQTKQALQRLPEQREIVFMPYKASMWECMESVWMAACEDEECVPYVVPIPYFDMQDGQVTEGHYEGDLFPEYVPVMDYRSFPLEEMHPAAIFIHNPFDNCNRVTSVLPQFYSGKLKECADKLIYIPYFVVNNTVYVTHRYLPSYDNMDFIAVQTEGMIDSFAEAIPREKFLPFGSPIADRVLRLEREKPAIPKAWKGQLKNGEDFGGDRAVMLNTSISQLMKEKSRFLDKIEYIFDRVKQIDGITLVWRPHPLLRTSAQSMGEAFLKRLDALEERFLREKIGVLDKTADVGIAVALCDAYLGESASSVIHMFGIAGKPRFFINTQRSDRRKQTLCGRLEEGADWVATGHCTHEGEEYFVLDKLGWVAYKKVDTQKLLPLFAIPDRDYIPGRAYLGMECKGEELWIYPENAKGTLVYHLPTGRMRKVFEPFPAQTQESLLPLKETDEAFLAYVRAQRFKKGNFSREWYEGEESTLADYFDFLKTAKAEELAGQLDVYQSWFAYLDGSCGRRILQAVKESL